MDSPLEKKLDTATELGLDFIIGAHRGTNRLDDAQGRALLGASTATLGAWSRNKQTETARMMLKARVASILPELGDGKTAE